MEQMSGVVERITFVNEENGFSVIKVKSRGYLELITVVGNMAAVSVGAIVTLRGEWKHDAKFGKQFLVQYYDETMPATIAGIEKYLGSGLIKGIGPVNARRIVKTFKEDTLRVIEEEPERMIEAEGIGPKRVEIIKMAWKEQKEIKNVMLFLQSYGVSTTYAVKIYKTYGNDSISIVKENPFRLADDIWGIGFKTADKIAGKLGVEKDSYERCRSGMIYALNELSNEGHCYAKRDQLIASSMELLDVLEDRIKKSLDRMIEDKSLIIDGEVLYLPPFYYSEAGVARRIRSLLSQKSNFAKGDFAKIIDAIQKEANIVYDEIQVEAVSKAAASKFMVLTGGPGTGKTTTTLAIIKVFERLGAKVALAAPTGRAAKRMAEATGMEAKTIHRLLEYKPPEGYKKNAENPLDCDVLIIDETSMVDILLMYNLLKALHDDTIVILVGDVDQLPSVGAGNVLRDIIDSKVVTVVNLKRIFRQAKDSMIVMNAHRINEGLFPILKAGKKNDFFFIHEDDPIKIAEKMKELCKKRLPGFYKVDPIKDIQVLCPMQKGDAGAHNMNLVLQEALNPSKKTIKYGGICFRMNDKVMQIRNNYDKSVFNGDVGSIVDIDEEDKTVLIRYDDNEVLYDATELDEVVLAYATTVHKSQGSEYKIVVAPFTMQHYMMLQRNLLYTCITRAKKAIVLIGSTKAIGIAIRSNKHVERNTLLAKRIKEYVTL